MSNAEWMGHSARQSAVRVNPGVTKSSCEIHSLLFIFQGCLHPQLMRATFWLKQWVQQQIIVGKITTKIRYWQLWPMGQIQPTACRGPAPADPGYSKERRLGEGQGITA